MVVPGTGIIGTRKRHRGIVEAPVCNSKRHVGYTIFGIFEFANSTS
jgi:hypothetical protein